MSHDSSVDPAFEAWLREELDAVPEPTSAVDGAIAASAHTGQREPLARRLRRMFKGEDRDVRTDQPLAPPETIIWADPSTARGHAPGAASARPSGVGLMLPTALVAVALAIVLAAAGLFLTLGPGSSLLGGAVPASLDPTAAPALMLEPRVDSGRDLIVAGDGSGHFWTLSDAVAEAVSADRIRLVPGEYAESVVITEDITITGSGDRDAVILTAGEADVDSDLTYVLRLDGSDAAISGLTVRGAEIGTAIIVEGGAPTLDGLRIDTVGSQAGANPAKPKQAIAIRSGSSAALTNSEINAFIEVSSGAQATLANNLVRRGCLRVDGQGTDAQVTENTFEGSECYGFSITVADGANADLHHNVITVGVQNDAIRVAGKGTTAEISSQVIQGGDFGIWLSAGADATVRRSKISEAQTGVGVMGADAVLDTLEVRYNGTGLLVDRGAAPSLVGNTICENGTNVDIRDAPEISQAGNDMTDPCPGEPQQLAAP